MGRDSKIEWCHHTANFWIGCSKVAEGCRMCYAENLTRRFGNEVWGVRAPRRLVQSTQSHVLQWHRAAQRRKSRDRVFVSSLSDFFDDGELVLIDHHGRPIPAAGYGLTDRWLLVRHERERAWATIDQCPGLDFLVLTKRPENIREMWLAEGPRANVWLGQSVATSRDYERARGWLDLLKRLARYTFLSVEPLIEPIEPELHREPRPDWVIVGGESGARARPCHVEWIRRWINAGAEHGVPIFVKQLGAATDLPTNRDAKGGDITDWPSDLRVRQFPRRPQGGLLNTWTEDQIRETP